MITNAEVARIAAEAAGVPAPAKSLPLPVSYALATLGTVKARLHGTDEQLSLASLRLMRAEAPVDCSQGPTRIGLAAKAGRGVDPRGGAVLGGTARGQAKEQAVN